MGPLLLSCILQVALTAAVYFMVVLTTCSADGCGLRFGHKTKFRYVILRNIDIRMCHVDCQRDDFILAWCIQLSDSGQTGIPRGTSPENHRNVLKRSCGSKVCNTTSMCLEKGCSKECVQTPSLCNLHSASDTGDLAKVKVILSQGGADINCPEWNGRTPVIWAASKGHREVVEFLVSKGAKMSLVDSFSINILHSACLGGDVELVKYVLSQKMVGINSRVRCGRTPVMLAAESGHKAVVELLVGKGADVSLVDSRRDSILHCACWGGSVEVVKYILSLHTVDVNSRGWKKKTPVMVAGASGHKQVVELLVKNGANVSLRDHKRNTVLHMACYRGHVDVVKYIVSRKMMDINTRGRFNRSPVMVAGREGHRQLVELLVNHGAILSLRDVNGYNILDLACYERHVDVVRYVKSQNIVDINCSFG